MEDDRDTLRQRLDRAERLLGRLTGEANLLETGQQSPTYTLAGMMDIALEARVFLSRSQIIVIGTKAEPPA